MQKQASCKQECYPSTCQKVLLVLGGRSGAGWKGANWAIFYSVDAEKLSNPPPFHKHFKQEESITELISVGLPEKAVMQFPVKFSGTNFLGITAPKTLVILGWRV